MNKVIGTSDTALNSPYTRNEGNDPFLLEISENKDVIFFPFKIVNLLDFIHRPLGVTVHKVRSENPWAS